MRVLAVTQCHKNSVVWRACRPACSVHAQAQRWDAATRVTADNQQTYHIIILRMSQGLVLLHAWVLVLIEVAGYLWSVRVPSFRTLRPILHLNIDLCYL